MKRPGNILKSWSLLWQLLLEFFLIFLLLFIIMEISQYLTMEQYLYKSKEQLLESRLYNIDSLILQEPGSSEAVSEIAPYLIQNTVDKNISAAVINSDGSFAADIGIAEGNRPTPRLSQDEYKKLLHQSRNLEGYRLVKDSQGNEDVVIWRKIGGPDLRYGLIQLSTSADSVETILHNQLLMYIIASVLILIIGWILVRGVLKYTLKPLYNMTNTVGRITVGKLDVRLPSANGSMEIDKLSYAFNGMLERIEASFEREQRIKEKMRRFISDASHELRTPLTSIHGFVEVLLRGAAKNENQLDLALNSILMESERLTRLVNDLLLLTKLDQQVPVEMLAENINEIIEEVYPQLQIIAEKRKIELQLKENICAVVNRNQFKQVIFNLVHNAIQHTDEINGVITICLDSMPDPAGPLAVLKVRDNGTGISQKDLNEIFDRFFRSESHRSRKHGGYGLGLSIVKSIIDAHDGKINVDSQPGKGTSFTIFLKLAK